MSVVTRTHPMPVAQVAGIDVAGIGTEQVTAVRFDGVAFPVVFQNCPAVMEGLRRVLHGWRYQPVPPSEIDAGGSHIEIARDRRGYRTTTTWSADELRNASVASTVCNLTVDLAEGLIAANRDLLCLHCGAALLDGRLVVFAGSGRAGKSTLVGRLAAAGVTIFSDDLLLLAGPEDHGRSLGIRGRLRLPLPEGCGADFRRFVAGHSGPRDSRYLYLDTSRFANFGASAPIGAVVVLDRRPVAGAHLVAAGRSEALQHLIRRNVAREAPADAIVDRLSGIMERAHCLRLEYSDLEDATSLILNTFGVWPADCAIPSAVGAAPAAAGNGDPRPVKAVRRDKLYRRNPDVTVREIDGELFLASVEGQAIWHLNALGAGVWNLLAEPHSPAELIHMLTVAFPEGSGRIAQDVDQLFAGLSAGGLVIADPLPSRRARPVRGQGGHRGSGAPSDKVHRR